MPDEDIKSLLEEIEPMLKLFKVMMNTMIVNSPQEDAARRQHINAIEQLQTKIHKQIIKHTIFY
jgi:hypothetical protein